jgi:hypothetical protein
MKTQPVTAASLAKDPVGNVLLKWVLLVVGTVTFEVPE